MAKEYIEREAVKRELLSWAVCMNHPEYLIKDDALHVIDSIPAADVKGVLTMAEYIENPLSGKLRGVTYEDGKIIAVHIRDTDDVVKVFVPVRHGRWKAYSDFGVTVQEWIPVEERLPEIGGYVVCIAKRNPFSRFMPMVARIEKNGWVNPITEQYISEVTHWMPMPNPPKGE